MLEMPESHTIADQLNKTTQNKTIQKVIANSSPHKFTFYFNNNPDDYAKLLQNKTITNAQALAGQVQITADNTKILFSDGANIRYITNKKNLPQKHQLSLEFTDNTYLVCTVQMYGAIFAFTDGQHSDYYYQVAQQKPSPLTDTFDQDYFLQLYNNSKKDLSIKAFLATEQRIPGLGNGTLQDILFKAQINPKNKLGTLTSKQLQTLFTNLKQTLLEMYQKGGRDTEKDLFSVAGSYKTILSKNTYKSPCPICKSTITKQAYLGGSIYYCPTCQPLVK